MHRTLLTLLELCSPSYAKTLTEMENLARWHL